MSVTKDVSSSAAISRTEHADVSSSACLAVPSGATYFDTVNATPNLIAYYRLGEASGPTVIDSGPNGHHGTYQGSPDYGVTGATADGDTAIDLEGSDGYITVPHHADFSISNELTVEFWLKFPVTGEGYYPILGKKFYYSGGNGDNYGFYIYRSAEEQIDLEVYWGTAVEDAGSNYTASAPVATPSGWHQYVVVLSGDGETSAFYIDGVSIGVGTPPDAGQDHLSDALNTKPVTIAQTWDDNDVLTTGGGHLEAALDEVSIYGRALTSTEIDEHFDAAAIVGTQADLDTSAAISRIEQNSVTSSAAISATGQASVSSTAAISRTETRDVSTSAALAVAASSDVSTTAALSAGTTLSIASTAAVTRTEEANISTSGAISQNATRDVSSSAALSQTGQSSVSSSAATTAANNQNVASSAAISLAAGLDVSSTASISRAQTTDVSTSASIVVPVIVNGDVSTGAALAQSAQVGVSTTAAISVSALSNVTTTAAIVTTGSAFSTDDRSFTANWDDSRAYAANWIDDRSFSLQEFGMTKVGVKIKNIVKGDNKRIQRNYSSLPTGSTVTGADLYIKKKEKDEDASALIHKAITTTLGLAGQVTDESTADGDLDMFFDLASADTALTTLKPGIAYPYAIRVTLTGGAVHTMEKGTIEFIRP